MNLLVAISLCDSKFHNQVSSCCLLSWSNLSLLFTNLRDLLAGGSNSFLLKRSGNARFNYEVTPDNAVAEMYKYVRMELSELRVASPNSCGGCWFSCAWCKDEHIDLVVLQPSPISWKIHRGLTTTISSPCRSSLVKSGTCTL